MLGCKAWLDKFKTIEITSSIFCNNNAVRLEVKYKKKLKKKKKPPKHKCMEAKQYAKQPVDHWRNQSGKKKKKT